MPYSDPERQKRAKRESARRRRAARRRQRGSMSGSTSGSTDRAPDERSTTPGAKDERVQVSSARDVLAVLVDELGSVRGEEPTLSRGRVVALLTEKVLRALEVADLDERLSCIEDALNAPTAVDEARRRWGAS